MPRGSASAREPLSRGRVLRAAIALADAEGVDAVSMRRLAEGLGVVPMALYKHVADKDDLLDGMVDTLIGDMQIGGMQIGGKPIGGKPIGDLRTAPALQATQWRAAVRDTILGARAVVTAHPWARRAIETRTIRTPAVLGHMERLTQLFLGAGFSPDLTHHVMHLLGNRIWGFSPELFNDPGGGRTTPTRKRTSGTPDPQDYPGILLIAADAQARRPGAVGCDEDFEFDFALGVILDGVARLHRSKWASDTARDGE